MKGSKSQSFDGEIMHGTPSDREHSLVSLQHNISSSSLSPNLLLQLMKSYWRHVAAQTNLDNNVKYIRSKCKRVTFATDSCLYLYKYSGNYNFDTPWMTINLEIWNLDISNTYEYVNVRCFLQRAIAGNSYKVKAILTRKI